MRSAVATVALLILAVQGASAAPAVQIHAAQVHVEGASVVVGPFQALNLMERAGGGAVAFTLHAEHLKVERDISAYLEAGSVLVSQGTGTSKAWYDDATVTGLEAGSDHSLTAFATEGSQAHAQIRAGGVTLRPNPSTVPLMHLVDPERSPDALALEGGVHVAEASEAVVRIQGDLSLSLWSWRFHVESPQGSSTYRTGQVPSAVGMQGQLVQAYLVAVNATLILHSMSSGAPAMHLASLEAHGADRVVLESASGVLGGTTKLLHEDVHIEGTGLNLALAGPGDGLLRVELPAQSATAHLQDGRSIPLGASVEGSAADAWHGAAVAVLLLAAVVAALYWVRRRTEGPHATRRLNAAQNLLEAGWPRVAAAVAGDVVRRHPEDVAALAVAAEAHGRAGRFDKELEARLAADGSLVDRDRSENSKRILRLLAQTGRGDEAFDWLEHCRVLGGPGVLAEVQQDAAYAALLEDKAFRQRVRRAYGLDGYNQA